MNEPFPRLDEQQQQVVQLIYDVFREEGRWPIVAEVDRLADDRWELDAYPVLRSLPTDAALLDRRHLPKEQPVKLRLATIAGCAGSAPDVSLFVRFVQWLAEKERTSRPATPDPVRVTSRQLRADLMAEGRSVGSVALAKAHAFADVEHLSSGGTSQIGGDPAAWEIDVPREIRPFRRIDTFGDYLATRGRMDADAVVTPQALPVVSQPSAPEPYVFIAMPFGAPWSDAVHLAIERACARVHADGTALRWERADQIIRPGRITNQLVDSLSQADVIVADITDNNANVIYEVGYADANRVPLVVLNQNPSASPFDLHDLRQIEYATDDLDDLEERLAASLSAAIVLRAT